LLFRFGLQVFKVGCRDYCGGANGGVGGFGSAPIQAARVTSYQGFIKTTQWPSIVTAVAETLKTGQWLKFAPFRTMSQAGYALTYWAITTNFGAKK